MNVSKTDHTQFIMSGVLKCVTRHLENIRIAEVSREGIGGRGVFHLVPQLSSPVRERNFLRNVCEYLLVQHLPEECLKCTPLRVFLREVITFRVLEPLIENCCNPDWINQQIIFYLRHPISNDSVENVSLCVFDEEETLKEIYATNNPAQLSDIRQKLLLKLKTIREKSGGRAGTTKQQNTTDPSKLDVANKIHNALEKCYLKMQCLMSRDFVDALLKNIDCRHGVSQFAIFFCQEVAKGASITADIVPKADPVKDSKLSAILRAFDQKSSRLLSISTDRKGQKHEADKKDTKERFILKSPIQNKSPVSQDSKHVDKASQEMVQQSKKTKDIISKKLAHSNVWNEGLGKWKVYVEKFDESSIKLFVHPSKSNEEIQQALSSTTTKSCNEWVIERSIDQFNILMKKLFEIQPAVKPLLEPVLKKRPFNSSIARSLSDCQKCFDVVMLDEKLFESEIVYEFLSPFSEHKEQKSKKTSFLGSLGSRSETDDDSSTQNDTGEPDVAAEPLFLFLEELCDLRGAGKWLRKTLITFVQMAYGKNITRHIQEILQIYLSKSWNKILSNIQSSDWSESQNNLCSTLSFDESQNIRNEAKELLMGNLPDSFITLVGLQNARKGAFKVFQMLQHHALNKNLFYTILEELLLELYPNLLKQKIN